ncbi:MAG: MFS transporter [Alphaproteobacteria bacterium]|nr:MFS transporter [Alphaproteobacteria bacterium]
MSMRRALRSERGYGVFWSGFCASVLGDAITRTTLVWYVFELTGSSVSLGWLSFCFTAPVIVGGIAAGWLLDRYDRRTIMAIDSLAKSLVVFSVPVLATMDALPLWYVYVVASVFGFLMMIPLAGVPSLLPALVSGDDLNAANALETIGYTTGGVLGPPLAGLLIAQIGPLDALYLDAASYLVFAWAVWRCRPRPEPGHVGTGDETSLLAAVRVIARNPVLASTTLMYLAFNVGLGALLVVVPVFADTVLGGGPELYGLLLGCIAIGQLVSSVTIGVVRLPIPTGLAICLTLLLSGVAVAAVAMSPNVAGVAVALALYGVFIAPLTIWGQTLRMKIIPPGFHGRCFAIMRTLMQSGGPLGGVSAGFAVPVIGVRAAIAAIALITVVIGGLGLTIAELRRAR